jgi:phytoene desaturase
MSRRVVIIGAGPGGLASAMLLARAGCDVTVLEKQPRIGGRTSSIKAQGYTFDLGPTFFLYPQVLREIFAQCGRDLFDEIPMTRLDPQYRIVFGAGGELNATSDVARMMEEIARLSPRDAPRFARFLRDNRAKLKKFAPCLQTPFLGWSSLLNARLLSVLPYLKPWRSLHRELASYFKDPRLQLAFTFQSKYLGMSPFQCPSLFSILSFLEYEHGVWHPRGGCNSITAGMARIAEELGASIELEAPVEKILFSGKRAIGVRTHAGDRFADAVVLNGDFAHAITRLVPNQMRRRWSDEKIKGKKFSCSTFMLYLGFEGRCRELAHHTIYVARDYRRNLEEIEQQHVLSEDPSFYVQNASVTDPTLAPPGHTALYVLLPVSHQHPNIDWSRERSRYREVALRQLARLGLTNIESRIRFERVITPADWEQHLDIHRGATFNLAHSFSQMLHLRPRNRFDDCERLYLAGGGTHPGSGLPVIFESARITSKLLLKELPVAAGSERRLVPA